MLGLAHKVEQMNGINDENGDDIDPLQKFNFSEINTEIQMEKVRQDSSGHNFNQFANSLRKNMMEKKIVLDTDGRGYLHQSLTTLRETFLSDCNVDFQSRLRMLADVLNCQIISQPGYHELKRMELVIILRMDGPSSVGVCSVSWFQEKPQPCDAIKKLLQENRWGELEAGLSRMLEILPTRFAPPELEFCLHTLSVAEKDLLVINSTDSNWTLMERVNQLPIAHCQPRSALNPFTIYLLAEPILFRAAGDSISEDVLSRMTHATLCISETNTLNILPDSSLVDSRSRSWLHTQEINSMNRRIKAAFCLKLSSPILLSAKTVAVLESLAGTDLIYTPEGRSVNYFESIFSSQSSLLYSRLSHSFAMCFSVTKEITSTEDENASIITEVHTCDHRHIPQIVQLLRHQLVFNSLLDGIARSCSSLAMCATSTGFSTSTKRVGLIVSPDLKAIEMTFDLNNKMAVARINVAAHRMSLEIQFMDQSSLDQDTLRGAQQIMDLTWSLPLVMHGILCSDSKIVDYNELVKMVAEKGSVVVKASPQDFGVSFDDKIGDAWLAIFKHRRPAQPLADLPLSKHNELVFEMDRSLVPECGFSLLSSFKELDAEEELICPPPPQRTFGVDMSMSSALRVPDLSSVRSNRLSTDGVALNNALSDLDAIAEMGNDDTDSVISENSGRSSTVERCSPSVGQPGFRSGVGPTPQSPSEMQRRATQSMVPQVQSSALAQMDFRMKFKQQTQQPMHQQTPPSAASSDVFDFASNEDSNGSGHHLSGSTPSSGNATPFTAGSMTMSPFQFPAPGQGMMPQGFPGPAGYNARGISTQAAPKRRGRGRKSANLGDRQPSLDSLSSPILDPMVNISAQLPSSGVGSRGGKQRGASTQRRPRKPRRGSVTTPLPSIPHQFHPYAMVIPGQLQRSFPPDLTHSSMPPQLHPSDSSMGMAPHDFDYEDESSDGETDPPPPPKSALPPTLPPAIPSAPILTPSVTPVPKTASAATSFSALLNERSESSLHHMEAVQIQKIINEDSMSSKPTSPAFMKGRKSSLESIFSKTQCAAPPLNRFNDLYDDGTQSPSPPPTITKRESPRPSSVADSSSSGAKIVLKLPKQNQSKSSSAKSSVTEMIRMSSGQPPSSRVGKESSRSKHSSSSSSRPSKILTSDEPKSKKSSKRKATSMEQLASSSSSTKKQRNSGNVASSNVQNSPTTNNALPFGFTSAPLPKSFKIPKVNEPEPTPSASTASSSSNKQSTLPFYSSHATGSNTIPIQPVRPKSILKNSSFDQQTYSAAAPTVFTSASGNSGRRTLLPPPSGTTPLIPTQPTKTSGQSSSHQSKRPSLPSFNPTQFFSQMQKFPTQHSQHSQGSGSAVDEFDFNRDSPGAEEGMLRIVDDHDTE